MLNWINWPNEIIKLLGKLDNTTNWETVFKEFYVDDVLSDPLILFNKREKLDSCHKIVDNLEKLYKKIIYKLTNIENTTNTEFLFKDFLILSNDEKNNLIKNYDTILKYKSHKLNLYPINPFNLGIPSYTFQWIKLFHDKIPNNFKIHWNVSMYSEFQIKIHPDSNIFFITSNNVKHRILKYNNYTIYIFEKIGNVSNVSNNVVEINFKTKYTNTKNCENNELIHFSFNQEKYDLNQDSINLSLYKIELLLNDFGMLQRSIQKEQDENNKNIMIYENKFNIKKRKIHLFLEK